MNKTMEEMVEEREDGVEYVFFVMLMGYLLYRLRNI